MSKISKTLETAKPSKVSFPPLGLDEIFEILETFEIFKVFEIFESLKPLVSDLGSSHNTCLKFEPHSLNAIPKFSATGT